MRQSLSCGRGGRAGGFPRTSRARPRAHRSRRRVRRANQRAEARDPLTRGLDLADRCGAAILRERALDERAAMGAHPRRNRLTGIDALTASERRVAQMAARGLSNVDIAQMLFVTRKPSRNT